MIMRKVLVVCISLLVLSPLVTNAQVQSPEPLTTEIQTTETVIETVTETVEPETEITESPIDENDLEMLAHLLNGEAGANWCTDEMIYYVGSVVLNRVESEYFPDTIEGVIFQKGQYASTWDGNYDKEPTQRCYEIAEDLLLNGSVLPKDVVYQAEFKQGSGVYKQVQNMYFCYL